MEIPILSGIVEGVRIFFKKRRYLAYFIVFVATTFLGLFISWLMTITVGTSAEGILVNFFAYIGSAGTIYFALGSLFTGLGVDNLWLTRRSRGRTTELKGVSWMAISFAISVFLSLWVGPIALLFFAILCWVGWIAFQAYLSTRTSLRVATLAEPKKGGFLLGTGSFIILLIGLVIIGAEAVVALSVAYQFDFLSLGPVLNSIFSSATQNLIDQHTFLLVAYIFMGLFALVMLFAFLRYFRRGASLNIAILTLFISIYAGYFLVNVMRRGGIFGMTPVDIVMSLFFLVYAMSGIGATVTEAVEESRARTGDFGPLLTFFLASGYFFVDSIIAVASNSNSIIWNWFNAGILADPRFFFLFRDVAKLMAFPLVAIFTAIYYLRVERAERVVHKAEEKGETLKPEEVDSDIAEEIEEEEKKPKSPARYSTPEPERDSGRLHIDSSRRLGAPKRYDEDED